MKSVLEIGGFGKIIVYLCFLLIPACRRGGTVSDVFATDETHVDFSLEDYHKKNGKWPQSRLEINFALGDFDGRDPWGREYRVTYVSEGMYLFESRGADGLWGGGDDEVRSIECRN